LSLAGRGVRVLLIDRAQFPRWKPCAGGLTLKTRPYIPEPLFDLVECTVQGAYLTFGAADVTHIRSETPLGWMIHRESFDHAHLELVRSCETVDVVLGVTVREIEEQATGVLVSTDHETFQAGVLVGADGAKSVVSKALPGHEDRLMGFAYEGEARAAEASLAEDTLFDFHTFPRGYGWVFPKGDHYSLGGFVCGEKLPGVKDLYRDFCSESGVLRGVETYRARGHPVSLGGSLRRLNSRRVLLAGEAGGLVDPLTGEGIYYALRSGHLAARHIADFLERGVPLDAYGNRIREEIQEELRVARVLAKWLYDHPALSYRLMFRNSLFCKWFAEISSGLRTYRGLLPEILKHGVRLPFHASSQDRREVPVNLPPA
jgi:geranylgeranyl reductase family protein